MRWLIVLACACGGGGASRSAMPITDDDQAPPISVEWKVEAGEQDMVNVAIVVDGTRIDLAPLEGTSMHEIHGGPHTCALRAANPRRTEIVCGQGNAYAAALVERVLAISLITDEQTTHVRDVPVNGGVLSVKNLALPTGP